MPHVSTVKTNKADVSDIGEEDANQNKMSLKQLAQAGDLDLDFGLGEEDEFVMAGTAAGAGVGAEAKAQQTKTKREVSVLKPIPLTVNMQGFARRSSRLSKKYSDNTGIGQSFEYGGEKTLNAMDSFIEGQNPLFGRKNSKNFNNRGGW